MFGVPKNFHNSLIILESFEILPRKSHVCVEKCTIKACKIQIGVMNHIKHLSLESWCSNCESVIGIWWLRQNFNTLVVCIDMKCFQLGKLLIFWCLVVKLKIGTYFWHWAHTKNHNLSYIITSSIKTSTPSSLQSQSSINYNSSIQLNITDFAHRYTDEIHINNHFYTYNSHKLCQYICHEKIHKKC